MLTPPIPHDETMRLARLFEYCVLDTAPEPSFDDLTELIASMLDVPIALVSLVDEKRQWFKSHHGLDASETPREYAFCAHAILNDGLFVVEDSHLDERFSDNPLVQGAPQVRFYAGMPLITNEGYKIGTLCGIDHKPRVLDYKQKRALEIVSRQVIGQLELRKNISLREQLFRQQNHTLKRLESANQEVRDFVSVVVHDLRAPVLNASGFSEELLIGSDQLQKMIAQSGEKLSDELQDAAASIIENDIRDSALHIKRSAEQMDERISAISQVAKLGRRDLQSERVDLNQVVAKVFAEHESSLKALGGEIHVDNLPIINVDKISVQLIVENIIANAVKYRDEKRPLEINIHAQSDPHGVVLHFKDNGRGIATDDLARVFAMFRRVGKQDTEGDGTGLAFSRTIVNRLGGRIWCESVPGEETIFHVFLPEDQESHVDWYENSA